MNDPQPYLSGLSEQELHDLWMALKQKSPVLYEKYRNPDFTKKDYDEEARSVDLGIYGFVVSKFPNLHSYWDQSNIHRDMRTYFHIYLSKRATDGS